MAKILIADDDTATQNILTHILSTAGYDVICASDGIDALELIKMHKPDLLILDLMMPRLDGLGVLIKLYGSEKNISAPSILLTAQDPSEYKEIAESFGATLFMEKPFEVPKLLSAIKEALNKK